MSSIRTLLTSTAAVLVSLASVANAQTSFTYQGRLDRDGAPQTGIFDLQFSLFNDPTSGAQIGSTICSDDVIVAADGTFTTTLDFGQLSFLNPMHLEIGVRPGLDVACTDPRDYDVLPRQPLTASPMALNALRLNGLSSTFFTSASNISSGLLADARLSSNIPRLSTNNTFSGSNTFTGTNTFTLPVAFQSTSSFTGQATFIGPSLFQGQATLDGPAVYTPELTRTIDYGAPCALPASNFNLNRSAGFTNAIDVGTSASFEFPIVIPNVSTITGVTVHVVDNSAASNFTVNVQRAFVNTGGVFNMATISPVLQSASPSAISPVFSPDFVNVNESHSVRVSYIVPADPSTMRILGVSVTYTITASD